MNNRQKMREELNKTGYTKYKSYLIKECFNNFNVEYYTIINTKLKGHVHSSTFNIALKICDIANDIEKGVFNPKERFDRSIVIRAEKLYYRKAI